MTPWASAAQHGARRPADWPTAWAARPVAILVLINAALLPGVFAAQTAAGRKSAQNLRAPASAEELRKARTALAEKSQEMEAQATQLQAERRRSALLAREVEQLSRKLKVEENKEFFLQRKLSKVRSDLLVDIDTPANASTAGKKDVVPGVTEAAPKTASRSPLAPKSADAKKTVPVPARSLKAPTHAPAAPRKVLKVGLIDARAGKNALAAGVGTFMTRISKAIAGADKAGKTAADDAGPEDAGGSPFDRLEEKLHEEDERIQAIDSESIPEGTEGAADEERTAGNSLEGATAGTQETSQPAAESVEPTQKASLLQAPVAASPESLPTSPDSSDVSDSPAEADAQTDASALESGSNEIVPLEAEEGGPDTLPAELKAGEASVTGLPQDGTGEAMGEAGMNSQAADAANPVADGAGGSDDIKSVLDSTVSSDDQAFLSQVAPGAADAVGSA